VLAAAGADLEAVGHESGRRAYAQAIHLGRDDLAAVLAELGARPAAEPLDELVGACRRGDRARALGLVAADPALREGLGDDEMICRASADGNDAAVALLNDLGVPLTTRGGGMRGTPLHWAGWWGRVSTTELLLDRGADPRDAKARFGEPLGWVVHGSRYSPRAGAEDFLVVAQRLVAAGAEVQPSMADEADGALADWLAGPVEPARPVRDDADHGGFGALGVAAHAAYLRALGAVAGAATLAVGDGFAVRTGVASNAENGVVAGRASDEEVAAAVAFLGGAPAQWVLPGAGAAAELHARLVASGARPDGSAVVMGSAIEGLDLRGAVPADVAVAASDDAEAWLALAAALGWLDDGSDDDDAARAARAATLRAPGVRHWLAHRGGVPIGMATAFLHEDTLAGLHLGVLPEHRRQGIARALIRAAVTDTPQARVALLSPTRSTEPLYARLGFVTVPVPPDRILDVWSSSSVQRREGTTRP
jgi:GNAT superfamily N-acetyltransferase